MASPEPDIAPPAAAAGLSQQALRGRPWVVAGISLGILVLCLAPWPGLGRAYVVVACHIANALASGVRFASGVSLRFQGATPELLGGRANADWHAIVIVTSVLTGAATRTALNLRGLGYVPTVTFVALALAWPVDPGRKAWLLRGIGFALVQVFVVFSTALPLALLLSSDRVQALALGPGARSLLRTLFEGVVVPPGMSFAVPACIWLLVVAAAQARRPRGA